MDMVIFKKAILIVHGFAGGTYDQEYLANYLESIWNFDVYTYTLPGHSHIMNNKSTCNDWIQSSESMIRLLQEKGYSDIYVIGHSMGGVIASYLATQYKEVKKLVLIAPAFKYLSFETSDLKVVDILKVAPEILSQYGKDEVASRLTKLPVSTVKEFIKLVKKYQNTLEQVEIPTLIIQGTMDKIVPSKTAVYVYDHLKTEKKKIIYVKNSTHDVLREQKKEGVSHVIEQFLKKGIGEINSIEEL